jgi:hypothetical protein
MNGGNGAVQVQPAALQMLRLLIFCSDGSGHCTPMIWWGK